MLSCSDDPTRTDGADAIVPSLWGQSIQTPRWILVDQSRWRAQAGALRRLPSDKTPPRPSRRTASKHLQPGPRVSSICFQARGSRLGLCTATLLPSSPSLSPYCSPLLIGALLELPTAGSGSSPSRSQPSQPPTRVQPVPSVRLRSPKLPPPAFCLDPTRVTVICCCVVQFPQLKRTAKHLPSLPSLPGVPSTTDCLGVPASKSCPISSQASPSLLEETLHPNV